MSSMTATTPTSQHWPWCPEGGCEEERDRTGQLVAVYHWSKERSWAEATDNLPGGVEVVACDSFEDDQPSDPPAIHLRLPHGDDPLTVDQFQSLAEWLRGEAARIRAMVSRTTGRSVTVLDADLDLSVETLDADTVLLWAPGAPNDGSWYFSPDEARALAAALVAHAAEVDAR